MTPYMTAAFAAMELNPTTTPRTRLIITRRICRWLCTLRQAIHDERRALRRQAVALRRHLPFTKAAVEALEQEAATHRSDALDSIRRVLAGYGALLIRDPEGTAAALGFDGLCDVLNVNAVEREQARREGLTSLEELAFVYGMEDSAERRGDSWKDGPLFNACHAALAQFIKETPRDLLPDPFGPGGPLYGVPVRVLHPDGTITTKRPDLTLHDSKGSRVVKR
ncbi:hypothetical protein SAMN04244579_03950 [Azotobacter beijerinckii]|uniref:Uncharacterized protein n=1 Tax=Azotobacter beijerinckii TaxID=170623 RepID=A0A1H6XY02_9GAMM|nr:hypothetical protein [Azotobacter beijerinckii]SEJ33066.1 hypothetical protein SAMN04244579_03950 [Azotobacter beijerinckii]